MGPVGRFLRSAVAVLHSVCGWLAFRIGWAAEARRRYERVLALRGDDFSAYVHLGRLSFAAGDYAGWRREFEHARRTDPHRFAKLGHPFEVFEPRLAGTDFDDTGERATWRSLRPFGGGGRRQPRPDVQADPGLEALLPGWDPRADALTDEALPRTGEQTPRDAGEAGGHDDCSSPSERLRFHLLGPIRARDVAACDLDDLARKLSG
jgi:hypothetical protein